MKKCLSTLLFFALLLLVPSEVFAQKTFKVSGTVIDLVLEEDAESLEAAGSLTPGGQVKIRYKDASMRFTTTTALQVSPGPQSRRRLKK